jgi:hypothetical protein
MYRKILLLALFVLFAYFPSVIAQVTGSFKVYGSEGLYYPVVIVDGAEAAQTNMATVVQLGRNNVHQDSTWRGSFISQIRFHANDWGTGADFINVDLRQHENGPVTITNFIGGWTDVSYNNSTSSIVIWLRGGGSLGTTYYYSTNYAINPAVYDGVQNALPYQVVNGPTISSISTPYPYVNQQGPSVGNMEYATGFNVVPSNGNNAITINNDLNASYSWIVGGTAEPSGWVGKLNLNYLNYSGNHPRITVDSLGNVGIGTQNPQSLLAVEGNLTAKQLNITQTGWSDFVFDSSYQNMSLENLATYVKTNKHLPDIPSAAYIAQSGLDVGAMQKLHMQKIEELTLYAIEANRQINAQDSININQQKTITRQQNILDHQQMLLDQMQAQLQKQQGELDKLKETQTAH